MACSFDALLAQIHDPDSNVRRAAAAALGGMGEALSPAQVQAIVKKLADPDNAIVGGGSISVRRVALLAFTALCESTPTQPEAVVASAGTVAALLSHEDEDAREMAVRAMAALGSHADITALIAVVNNEEEAEEAVRAAAVDALLGLHAHLTATQLGVLAAGGDLSDESTVRAACVQVLGGAGAAAVAHVPTLLGLANDDDDAGVRAAAVAAVGAVAGPPPASGETASGESGSQAEAPPVEVVEAIGALLEDSEAVVRAAAIVALGRLGALGAHEETLAELMADRDREVRARAAAAIKQLGGDG